MRFHEVLNVCHPGCVNKICDNKTTSLYTTLYYSNLKGYIISLHLCNFLFYIFLKSEARRWLSRPAETCSFLNYCNKVFCVDLLFIVAYCTRITVELQLPDTIVLESDGNSSGCLCNCSIEVALSCVSPFDPPYRIPAVSPETEVRSLVAECKTLQLMFLSAPFTTRIRS